MGAAAFGSCGAPISAGATPSAGASTTAAACWPQGAHTIVADREARIFILRGAVYGCSLRSGRRSSLGQLAGCIGTERANTFALAGELAGYGSERCGIDTGFSVVVVRSLATGKQLRAEAAMTGVLGPESYVSVRSLVLRGDRALAWIAAGGSIVAHGQTLEVHRADARGQALLDSGTDVDPSSLRLRRSRLTWKRGRAMRSADLR